MVIRTVCLFVLLSVVAGREYTAYGKPYPCPFGFSKLHGTSNCYRFSTERETWFGALKKCQDMRGFLARIDSKKENDAIRKYLLKTLPSKFQDGENHDIWIGLTDRKKEGFWMWEETGVLVSSPYNKNVSFNNWAPEEPNSRGAVVTAKADCARLNNGDTPTDPLWAFADWTCDEKFYYLCEYEVEASKYKDGQ